MLSTLIALSLASAAQAPAPEMRIRYGDLDLSRPEHARAFVIRARTAATDFCALHRDLVTPQSSGEPEVCVRGMTDMAAEGLPHASRRDFVRSGGRRLMRQAR